MDYELLEQEMEAKRKLRGAGILENWIGSPDRVDECKAIDDELEQSFKNMERECKELAVSGSYKPKPYRR